MFRQNLNNGGGFSIVWTDLVETLGSNTTYTIDAYDNLQAGAILRGDLKILQLY